jgi:hypothetical protein
MATKQRSAHFKQVVDLAADAFVETVVASWWHARPRFNVAELRSMATPKERHSLFRFGAFVAARDRRHSINVGNRPPTFDGVKLSWDAVANVTC